MRQISIGAARVANHMTQQQLADKMGVSRKTVNNWETGRKSMRRINVLAFCRVTGFEETDLIFPNTPQKEEYRVSEKERTHREVQDFAQDSRQDLQLHEQ